MAFLDKSDYAVLPYWKEFSSASALLSLWPGKAANLGKSGSFHQSHAWLLSL
jgi:hypothetical protein